MHGSRWCMRCSCHPQAVWCWWRICASPASGHLSEAMTIGASAYDTDLMTILEQRGRLAESDARRIFTRIVLATKRAHDCGAVLRNLKPENVHVRQAERHGEFEVCLTQLHCAAPVPQDADSDAGTLTGLHGTPEYCAPRWLCGIGTSWYRRDCRSRRLCTGRRLTCGLSECVST